MKALENKVAVVTGGSRGIGRAIAVRLARNGAKIAITCRKDISEARETIAAIEKIGGHAKAYQADAMEPENMSLLVDAVMRDFKQIDIVVNNAGVFEGDVIGKASFKEYRRVMTINVDSVFTLTSAAVKHLKHGGRIINISSCLGERASGPGMSIYNASKFAVCGLTRSWAWDLGESGITVNAVLPGSIDTDLNPANAPTAAADAQKSPRKRFGTPEDVAGVVAFLASDESSNVNGACWTVDGGRNA
jgi:3-oxoacyl-[acyl-carrier protein] reductase